jgi:hypothetical protein
MEGGRKVAVFVMVMVFAGCHSGREDGSRGGSGVNGYGRSVSNYRYVVK